MRIAIVVVVGLSCTRAAAEPCTGDEPAAFSEPFEATPLDQLTGRVRRHSKAFYKDAIKQLRDRLAGEPDNYRLLDEIAELYRLMGQSKRAFAVLDEKEAIKPRHDTTEVRRAELHMQAGKLEIAKTHFARALEVNPNALGGTAGLQKLLIDYTVERDAANRRSARPLMTAEQRANPGGAGFFAYLKRIKGGGAALLNETLRDLGTMIQCGYGHSPVVLEAYGDALQMASPKRYENPRELAARAYLRAGMKIDSIWSREQYRALATAALGEAGPSFKELKAQYKKELRDARKWLKQQRKEESKWLKEQRQLRAAARAEADAATAAHSR